MPDPYVHIPPATFDALVRGEPAPLPPAEDHHVRRVLRLAAGDRLTLSDGAGREAPGRLADASARLDGAVREIAPPRPAIHLLQGLAKGRKVDEVVRAGTELGLSAVTVVVAQRSVVELRGTKVDRARDRWISIARSAASQSRRAHVPTVDGPVPVAHLPPLDDGQLGLVAHVGAEGGLRPAVAGARDVAEVLIAIGPEGGWTEDEVAALATAGYTPVHLGPSVLRTEHAGVVAAGAVGALSGWMG